MNDACNTTGSAMVGNTITKTEMKTIIDVTPRAVEKLKEFMIRENKQGYGLRVQVLPGGCSGYSYSLTFENKPLDSDIKLEFFGVRVFVDKMSEPMLQGSTIDFVESLQGSGFTVNNPNVHSSCGCGKSFS